jgi:hypothetical protein
MNIIRNIVNPDLSVNFAVKKFQGELNTVLENKLKKDGDLGNATKKGYGDYFDYMKNKYESETSQNDNVNTSTNNSKYQLPDISEKSFSYKQISDLSLLFDETNEKSVYEQFVFQISTQLNIDYVLLKGTLEKIYLALRDDNIYQKILNGNFSDENVSYLEEAIFDISDSENTVLNQVSTEGMIKIIRILVDNINKLPEKDHPDREKNTDNILQILDTVEKYPLYKPLDPNIDFTTAFDKIINTENIDVKVILPTIEEKFAQNKERVQIILSHQIAEEIFKQNNNLYEQKELSKKILQVMQNDVLEKLDEEKLDEEKLDKLFETEKGSFDYNKIFEKIFALVDKKSLENYSSDMISTLLIHIYLNKPDKSFEIDMFSELMQIKKTISKKLSHSLVDYSELNQAELEDVLYNEFILYLDGKPENMKRMNYPLLKLNNEHIFNFNIIFEVINNYIDLLVKGNSDINKSNIEKKYENIEKWSDSLTVNMIEIGNSMVDPLECYTIKEGIECKEFNKSNYDNLISVVKDSHRRDMLETVIDKIAENYTQIVENEYSEDSKTREEKLSNSIKSFYNLFIYHLPNNTSYNKFIEKGYFDNEDDKLEMINYIKNWKKSNLDVSDLLYKFSPKQIYNIVASITGAFQGAKFFVVVLEYVYGSEFTNLTSSLPNRSDNLSDNLFEKLNKFFRKIINANDNEQQNLLKINSNEELNSLIIKKTDSNLPKNNDNIIDYDSENIKKTRVGFKDSYNQVEPTYIDSQINMEKNESDNNLQNEIDYNEIIYTINSEINALEWEGYAGESLVEFSIKLFSEKLTNQIIDNGNFKNSGYEEVNVFVNDTLLNLANFLQKQNKNQDLHDLLDTFISDNDLVNIFNISESKIKEIMILSIDKIIEMVKVNKEAYDQEKNYSVRM